MVEWALAANSVAAFIDERCEKDADAIAVASDLFRAYRDWCEDWNGMRADRRHRLKAPIAMSSAF
jgi:phage/plasmid-associated DNA primase